MIKKIFTLLCLCTLCIGSAWGEEYSFTIQTSDFNTTSYSANDGSHNFTATCTTDATKTKTIACTTSNIMKNGSDMQWKKSVGCIYNTTDLGTIKSVTVNSSAGTFTTYYGTSQNPTSGTTVGNGYFAIKVGSETGKTSSVVVTFDDGVTPTSPYLSVSSATIDFGEVYQNAEVEAQEVTVSFANLTTNDVAAAISGSVFGINKTGSFTSGDKITITPNTATLGEYSETLTVSAIGVESKEVTITMNVVEAPSWIYKHVTNVSTLKAGDVIVLGCSTKNAAAGSKNETGTYLTSVSAQFNDGILTSDEAGEIELGGTSEAWTLTIDNEIIGSKAAKSLSFADDDATNTWTISIDDNGDATISSTNSSCGSIQYNASSPRFCAYASNQTAIQIYRKEVSATIKSTTGYATFSSDCALDLSKLPEGLTAYKAESVGNGKVHMVPVTTAVPANTGLFLKGTANASYSIPVAESGTALDGNLLEATTGESLAAGAYVYVIASDAFQPLGQATAVSKGKAYIPASKISSEGKLEITFNEPTGIENHQSSTFNPQPSQYNLQGVRVNPSTGSGQAYKGIVIMNGKKYINK